MFVFLISRRFTKLCAVSKAQHLDGLFVLIDVVENEMVTKNHFVYVTSE